MAFGKAGWDFGRGNVLASILALLCVDGLE